MSRLTRCLVLTALAGGALVLAARAQTSTPINLTNGSFNQDIIIGATETGPTTTTQVATWDFYEHGLTSPATTQGLPVGGIFLSEADSNIQFQFASYNHTNNALLVGSGGAADVTLAAPGSFQDIHFLTTVQAGTGNATVTVTLHFSDSSSTVIPTFTGIPDWTSSPAAHNPVALSNMGLVGNSVYAGALYLEQLDFALSAGDQAKTLDSFNVAFSGNGANTLMFFGASGTVTAVPEPSAFAALAGLGALGLAWLRRRRG